MSAKNEPVTTIFGEQVEPSVLAPPSPRVVRPTAQRALATAMAKAIFTKAESNCLKSKRPLSLIIVYPDQTAHKHLGRIISTMGNPNSFAVMMDEKGTLRSERLRDAEATEALGSGSGVICLVTSIDQVPTYMRVASQRTHVITSIDTKLIAEAIRDCSTGRVPKALHDLDVSKLSFEVICTAIGRYSRAADSVARITRAITEADAAASRGPDVPKLEDAVEFGAARAWGLDLKADIQDYIAGKLSWSSVDRGVVIHGVPGTGKSIFAKSLAQACGLPLVVSSMGELFATSSGDLGAVIKRQKQTFDQAKAQRPCILFLDELDGLPDINKLSGRGSDWWRPVILDFYIRLDSLAADREGIVVIGATNRLSAIDPALLRPGRLERSIEIVAPGAVGTERILRHHLRGELTDSDLSGISALAAGMTPARLMDCVRTASRIARRQNRHITEEDIRAAILGRNNWNSDLMRRVAIHEAGHAVATILSNSLELVDVSIVGSCGNAGHVEVRRTYSALTRDTFEEEVVQMLAGRSAEKVVLGTVSAGAGGDQHSDLAKATFLVAAMVASLGLDGDVVWRGSPDQVMNTLQHDGVLRDRVSKHLVQLQGRADDVIEGNRAAVEKLAAALMEKRRLSAEEARNATALVPTAA